MDGSALARMTEALGHRGPDGSGTWADAAAGIALGHRRLAVIDTSPAGHQPMLSESGRFVLAYNGEIYNHLDLREELAACSAAPNWRGHSDTETLLAAITHWGLNDSLRRAAGMFALALWDRKERVLHLARDRLGEKPLYYGWAGACFVFGSEIKALAAHPRFERRICPVALGQYLRFAYVPSPRSIWKGVFKLEPGCVLSLGKAAPAPPAAPLRPGQQWDGLAVARYWSLAAAIEASSGRRFADDQEALPELEAAMDRAVSRQMNSDVPLGAFLSGGIDSSLVVALMQKNSAAPVRTFTIGFEEEDFDESPHAAAVARHLGTRHTEIRVTAAEARAVIPRLPFLFDEPFADASQIPTFLVCQAARPHVTVALTGDGGDELFGGYPRYQRAPKVWESVSRFPFPLRQAVGLAATAVPAGAWDTMSRILPGGANRSAGTGDWIHRVGTRLSTVRDLDDLYLNLVSSWAEPERVMAHDSGDGQEVSSLLGDPAPSSGTEHPAERMMYQDALTYLPDDILCKVDRAAMGVSLETRAPFLDPDVVELAARLPVSMKIRGGAGKWALRQILYRHVPRELIERPKLGFFLPVGEWLRGPLRDWAETLLDPARLAEEGLLRPEPIGKMWEEHLSGRRDWTLQVWTILMLQAWAEANLSLRQ